MSSHSELTESSIHTPFRWTWVDAAAKTAEVNIQTEDINKIGLQLDTGIVYRLVDLTPTWAEVGVPRTEVTVSNVDVATAATLSWDFNLVGESPYFFSWWLSGNSSGNLYTNWGVFNVTSVSPEIVINDQSPFIQSVIDSSLVSSITCSIWSAPYTLYICHAGADGVVYINGPHIVTP